ncbi:MAG: tetratricopeptide repeat protein [Patescibacteria group bacterium]
MANFFKTKEKTSAPAMDGKSKTIDLIIFGCLGLIFFLCPIFFTGLVSQGLGFEKMMLFYFLVLIGVVAWVTKGIMMGELKIKRTPLDWPVLGTLALIALSTFFSVSKKDSLIGTYGNPTKSFLAAAAFVLFYYLLVNNITTERIKKLFSLLLGSSALLIIFSLLQLFSIYLIPLAITKSNSFNPLGSLTGLTMYLVIIIPMFVVAITQADKIYPKLRQAALYALKSVLGVLLLADVVTLFLLNGFTYWPVAIVSIVVVLMFFLSKVIPAGNNSLIVPVSVFLLLIIFLVLGNFNLVNLNLPAEVSLSRGASFDIAKSSVKKFIFLGSGPGTFYYSFSKFKGPEFNASPLWNVRFDSSTGTFFELAATIGILGALAVIAIALIAISLQFIALLKAEKKEDSHILLAGLASFLAIIIYSFLFSLSASLTVSIVIISTFAVVIAIHVYPEKFRSISLSFRASPKFALALAAVFLTVTAGVAVLFTMGAKIYLADFYARKAEKTESFEAKIENLNKAVSLSPYQDVYYLSLANNYMALANNEAMTEAKDQNKIQNYLSLAVTAGKQATTINPNQAASNESLALIYENASFYTRGALEWAENLYNKVSELEPDNPVPHLRIALINMARSNAETDKTEKEFYINEAIKKYDEAIAKKNDFAAAFYGKGVAYESLGKTNEAIEQLKSAAVFAGTNADYQFELGRMYFNRGIIDPDISQSASKEIVEAEVENKAADDENLSVDANSPAGGEVKKNEDLANAENMFLSILQANPNHANALYSLALLYQKTGEIDNAKIAVKRLLEIVTDEPTKEAVKKQFPGLYE